MNPQPLLVDEIAAELEMAVVRFFAFLPDLVVASVILVAGFVVGTAVAPILRRIGQRAHIDEKVQETPLGALFPDRSGAVAETFGEIAKYYVLLIAAFVAANRLGFVPLANWLERAVGYVPSLVGGLVVLVVGFFVADYAADAVREWEAIEEAGFSSLSGAVTKAFLYFVVTVIGLDTMGVDVGILYTLAQTFTFTIGLAVALAVGIALGLGGKEYVSENIDEWASDSKDIAAD